MRRWRLTNVWRILEGSTNIVGTSWTCLCDRMFVSYRFCAEELIRSHSFLAFRFMCSCVSFVPNCLQNIL